MKLRTHYDPITRVWSSPHSEYTFGDQSIGEVVFQKMKEFPDRIVEINHDNGHEVTCRELMKNSVNTARTFLSLGLTAGDVVLLLLNNHENCSPLCVGSLLIGAPFCALELGLDRSELFFQI